jgi:uncharacterized protein DUF3147
MRVRINFSAAKQTKWHEYALRFAFGGVVTALTGLVAKIFGPEIGGLFLAFPAIFPASATLIEKHERKKKERAGLEGVKRGRTAAGIDAAGAAIGTIGLAIFGLLVWKLLPFCTTPILLVTTTAAWLATSVLAWYAWRTL